MPTIRPFEIILIVSFAFIAIAGLFALRFFESKANPELLIYGEKVEIWGTFDQKIVSDYLTELQYTNKGLKVVTYIEKDVRTFESELLNAIAEGRSPDLVILPHTLLVTYRSKLLPISSDVLSERTFKDTYIEGAEIFMRGDGTYGIPIAVDPLVMYWNRDIFSSSGLTQPPKTWENLLFETSRAVTKIDDNRNISQSTVALGEYSNITHAKDIIAMLLFQAGSTVVEEHDGVYAVTMNQGVSTSLPPSDAVIQFYTQFSSPTKEVYSWNRAMNLDRTEFLNGRLGLYFGKGSEFAHLERDNANLNFDVAQVPQGSGVTTARNYADFYALSIPRASKNASGAYAVATLLAESEGLKSFTNTLGLAPAKRSLYTGDTHTVLDDVVYKSALVSHGWLDPSPKGSDRIFQTIIEQSVSGQSRTKSIVIDAIKELEALFR